MLLKKLTCLSINLIMPVKFFKGSSVILQSLRTLSALADAPG